MGPDGGGALGDIRGGRIRRRKLRNSITHSGTEDTVVTESGNITGVGTISVRTGHGTITEPQPANFSAPLDLDSIFVGGFRRLERLEVRDFGQLQRSERGGDPVSRSIPPCPRRQLAAAGQHLRPGKVPGAGRGPSSPRPAIITGGTGYYIVGGFAGGNYGSISTSYSTGNVSVSGTTSQSNSFYTGGFAGVNSGTIANSYESGNATSMTTNGASANDETGVVGGLVGQMNAGIGQLHLRDGHRRGRHDSRRLGWSHRRRSGLGAPSGTPITTPG